MIEGEEDLFAVADGLGEPVELEVEEVLSGKWRVESGKSLAQVEEGEGDGDGDVEAFGEAVHGYLYIFIGEVDGFGGESCELGAEDEGHGGGDVEVGDEGVVGVGGGGDDAVAAAAQLGIGRLDVGVGIVVDPLGGAHGDVAGGVEGVVALDDMDVLDAEAVAGAEDGGGIVRLVDILQRHGDVAGAEGRYAVDEGAAVLGDELCAGFVEGFLLGNVEPGEELREGSGVV